MATITTRAGKGAALTHQEVDANFTDLNTELGQKEIASNKGVANGYASLDSGGKVPASQLPSYVDDVVEAANLAAMPGTGETGKIYVALDTGKTYRWSGTAYVEISASPGSTDAVPEGSTNLYFTQTRARQSISASGSLSYNSSTGVLSYTQPTNVSTFTNDSGYITSSGTAANVSGIVAIANGGTGASTAPNARTNLGLAIGSNVQAWDADLDAIAALSGTSGFLKKTAANTWSLDTSTYLTGNQSISLSGDASGSGTTSIAVTLANSGVSAGTYRSVTVDAKGRVTGGTNPTTLTGYGITDAQPLDADLTAIAGLVGTSGFLKKTAADSWTLDTSSYLTGNQSITLSGDASGSGATAISVTLANSGVVAGTYNDSATAVRPFTVDAKGRVTSIGTAVTIAPAFSSVTGKPTTLSGYGITDAQPLDADLTSIAGLAGTSGFLKKTAANTWALDTNTYLTGNQTVTLSGDVTGSGATAITATLSNSGVTAGTYRSVTVDVKGRVTAGTNPTTLSGYGITDALSNSTTSTQSGYFGDIYLYDDSTPSHYLQITNSANLTAARSLSINVNDASRTVSLSGDLTVSAAATVSGTNTGDQTITLTGDVTGSGTGSFATTLANSGVVAGTYTKVTVDAKGRVTTGASLASGDLPTYTGTITSSQVTTALGYTPYNSTNPSGYITSSASITGNAATATTATNLSGGTVSATTGAFSGLVNVSGVSTMNTTTPGAAVYNVRFNGTSTNDQVQAITWSYHNLGDAQAGIYVQSSGAYGTKMYLATTDAFVSGAKTAVSIDHSGNVNIARGALTQGGNQVLHAANYTSYSPSLTGSGASGTWGISITGNAATVSSITSGQVTTALGYTPYNSTNPSGYLTDAMRNRSSVAQASIDTATLDGFYTQTNPGDSDGVLVFNAGGSLGPLQMRFKYTGLFEFRNKTDSTTWTAWKTVLHSSNYTSYSPSLTGSGASGTWGINVTGSSGSCTGNAATAYGLNVHTGRNNEANKVVRTDGNGYLQTGYINSSNGDENNASSPARVWGTNGSDSYLRTYQTGSLSVGYAASAGSVSGGLTTGNYSSYALPLSGGTLSGDLTLSTGANRTIQLGSATNYYWRLRAAGDDFRIIAGADTATAMAFQYSTWNVGIGTTSPSYKLHVVGDIYATSNVTAYSDERVKANWRQIDDGFVVKLAGVKSGIYDRTDIELTQAGVSAQSLRKVLPEAVLESGEGDLSVAYGSAAMVSAVELAKELVAVKKELAELRARIH